MLPGAVDHLGKLIVEYPTVFGGAILTTNFDPLIEISLSKHGGRFYRTVLHDDGKLGQTVADGTHIVHLHGYWHGFDTLHTPQQLVQQRPHLRRFLENIVEASTLVIIGYSGWDDVITRTLMGLLSDSTSNPRSCGPFMNVKLPESKRTNRRYFISSSPGSAGAGFRCTEESIAAAFWLSCAIGSYLIIQRHLPLGQSRRTSLSIKTVTRQPRHCRRQRLPTPCEHHESPIPIDR